VDAKTQARYEARARIMKALAHPTRLFIVDELAKREASVTDLTKLVGADVSTVSKHLSILRSSGIVQDQKRGAKVFYTVRVPCVLNWYSCVEGVLMEMAREQMDAAGGREE
jgi:DNA-binding transcriptional ArsR family regulator